MKIILMNIKLSSFHHLFYYGGYAIQKYYPNVNCKFLSAVNFYRNRIFIFIFIFFKNVMRSIILNVHVF